MDTASNDLGEDKGKNEKNQKKTLFVLEGSTVNVDWYQNIVSLLSNLESGYGFSSSRGRKSYEEGNLKKLLFVLEGSPVKGDW